MTKTEACQRVALAALLAVSMAAAHEARAEDWFKITVNGLDPNGFADHSAFSNGDGSDGAEIVVGAKPTPADRGPERTSGLGGIQVAAGGGGDKPGSGGTDPK